MSNLTRHEINLQSIAVLLSNVQWKAPSTDYTDQQFDETYNDFTLDIHKIKDYDYDSETLSVVLTLAIGNQIASPLFIANFEMLGVIRVSPLAFNSEGIDMWINTNCIFILLPFMREIVFSATKLLPCPPYMIPLLTVKDSQSANSTDNDSQSP